MKSYLFKFGLAILFTNCLNGCSFRFSSKIDENPLPKIFAKHAADLDSVLRQPEKFEVQIIYTQIDRDGVGNPHFKTWWHGVDSTRYFYPASTVKLPLVLLALEKINRLRKLYPSLNRNSAYQIDSLRPQQRRVHHDPTAPAGKPSVAHDIRQILVVSDNQAYNHLFEFLGREAINTTLREKGYLRTGILHRFDAVGRDHRYTSPMIFSEGTRRIFRQDELFDPHNWQNPQHSTQKGIGWLDQNDSLRLGTFDFSQKNWFALTDMEKMLRAIIFPDATPHQNRFNLTEDDYQFLYKYMGIFPSECDFPTYNTPDFPDGYCKFLMWGGNATSLADGSLRSFNKVGNAYGYLTDVAYIVDFQRNVEFILAATIHVNANQIYNDGKYEYETVGLPFFAKLGQAVLEYEQKRPRKHRPDLSKFKNAVSTSK